MSASPTQTAERDELLAVLERSERRYLSAVEGVSEAAAQARPWEGSWSILEITEHLTVSEQGMLGALEQWQEKTTPPDPEMDARTRVYGLDRTAKREAPAHVHPTGRWKTMAEALDAFRQSRGRTRAMAQSLDNPRGRGGQQGRLGTVDGYQLLLLIGLHCERHAAQIEEIKQKREDERNQVNG